VEKSQSSAEFKTSFVTIDRSVLKFMRLDMQAKQLNEADYRRISWHVSFLPGTSG
jgi:hypothetical protein